LVIFALFIALFYFGFSFIYTPLFIYFDKMDAVEAMKASRKIVTRHFFEHLAFFIVWIFIIGISALPLGLGLLVTMPALNCAMYYAWADITNYYKEDMTDTSDDLLRHLIG
jgi:uncharacterized membrane protein